MRDFIEFDLTVSQLHYLLKLVVCYAVTCIAVTTLATNWGQVYHSLPATVWISVLLTMTLVSTYACFAVIGQRCYTTGLPMTTFLITLLPYSTVRLASWGPMQADTPFLKILYQHHNTIALALLILPIGYLVLLAVKPAKTPAPAMTESLAQYRQRHDLVN